MKRPFLESIEFALAVSATLDHRSTRVPQISVEPLLPQHRGERGQERHYEACVQEGSGGDDFCGRVLLDRRDDGGFVWDYGMVKGEEDCAKERHGLVVWVRLELGINVDNEGRADCREQTRLRDIEGVRW